jgi:hypothetical protein
MFWLAIAAKLKVMMMMLMKTTTLHEEAAASLVYPRKYIQLR